MADYVRLLSGMLVETATGADLDRLAELVGAVRKPGPVQRYARVGSPTHRGGAVFTDSRRLVRRVAYAVWRYTTGADVRYVEARYVDGYFVVGSGSTRSISRNDWAWYKGEEGYSTLQECMVDSIRGLEDDLYVHNGTDPTVQEFVPVYTRYATEHGVNLTTAANSIAESMAEFGALAHGVGGRCTSRWECRVDLLDAWVASALLQIPEERERPWGG